MRASRPSPARLLVPLLVGGALLAACGEDEDAAPALEGVGELFEEDAVEDGDAWPPPELRGSGEAGTVAIEGEDVDRTGYAVDAVRRCDTTDFAAGDGRTREFWVQGIGVVDPDDEFSEEIEVELYTGTRTNPDSDMQGIRWDGPEGLFDGSAVGNGVWTEATNTLDGPPLEVTDDRITGELRLASSLGSPPVVATVDVAMPDDEEVDCG